MSEPVVSTSPLLTKSAPLPPEASSIRIKRPVRGSLSCISANFRSALTSVLVYRRRSLLTILCMTPAALVTAVASVLLYGVHEFPIVQMITPGVRVIFVGSIFVAFIASGLASINSILLSIVGRRQEICMRMVIGARRRDIRYQILFEALLLSCVGAILGILCALSVTFMFTLWLQLPISIEPVLLLLVSGIMIVVGVMCGIYPAWRASCVEPGETPRVE